MERLTRRGDTGRAYYPRCFEGPCNGNGCKFKVCPFDETICERLAAYEDSDCEPEEVLPKDKADEIALKLMRLADLESLCSYDRLRELAEADKDGRAVVRTCKGLSTKPDDGRQMVLEQAIAHLESLLRAHDFECEDCKRDHRELLELLVELKERRG